MTVQTVSAGSAARNAHPAEAQPKKKDAPAKPAGQPAADANRAKDGFDAGPRAEAAPRHPEKAVKEVNNAAHAYEGTKDAKEQMDQRLAEELGHVGPGLNAEQRKDFVAAFKKEHKEVYGAERRAAGHLADVLERDRGTLERQARECSSAKGASSADSAHAVARALGDLADSSQARRAVKVAGELLKDGPGIQALMGAGGAELKGAFDKVAENALPRAAGDVMARADGRQDALKQIEAMIHPFTEARSAYKAGKKTGEALGALRDAAKGDYGALEKLAKSWASHKPSAMEKGLAAVGVMFGATGAVKDKNFESAVAAFAKVKTGVEVLGKSVHGLAAAGEVAERVGQAGKIAGRFAPGVGAVLNLANAAIDWRKAREGGNPGSYVAAVGDLVSAAGAAVEAFGPPGAVVGAIVNGIGTAFSIAGEAINSLFGKHEESSKHEAARLLQGDLGLGKDQAHALAYSDPAAMKSAERYGLSPRQVQGLAAEYPSLLKNRYELARFQAIAKAEHVEPGQFGQMLDRVAKYMRDHHGGGADHGAAVDYFFRGTDVHMRQGNPPANDPNSTAVQPRPEWIRHLLETDFPELAKSLQWLGAH
ncbi:MAG TPA: hypothetical protein VND93_15895 [Myxococcales bacterium]|nr:hypothetical protein [Myxococcales bacterium]